MHSISKIDKERISNASEIPLIDSMECLIDNMIPFEPVMCANCQRVFCSDCIESWKKNSNKCPLRCEPLIVVPLKNSILQTQLEKIKLKCCFSDFGCKESLNINNISYHQKHCEYQCIRCEKCNEKIGNIELINHLLNDCKNNKINCFICLQPINFSRLNTHLKTCHSVNSTLLNNPFPQCSLCGLFYLNNKKHHCIGNIKESLTDLQKTINWCNVIRDFNNMVMKNLNKINENFEKESQKRLNVVEEVKEILKEKINEQNKIKVNILKEEIKDLFTK